MALIAYMDESGTHDETPITVVAGFIGTTEQWAGLEKAWIELLKEFDLPYFHAHEIERMWSDRPEIREHVKIRFAETAMTAGLTPVFARITEDAWRYFNEIEPWAKGWPSPYHFMFQMTIKGVTQWSRNNANSEPVAFFYDRAMQYVDRAKEIMALLRNDKADLIELAASETFADMRNYPGLQAADMFAYELFKVHGLTERNIDRRLITELVDRRQPSTGFSLMNRDDTWRLVRDHNERINRPVPPPPPGFKQRMRFIGSNVIYD
jgi:hypothetical protein